VCSDTLFSEVSSLHGHLFVTDEDFCRGYTMREMSKAYDKLNQCIKEIDILDHLITDNASDEFDEQWERVRKTYLMHQWFTEPCSPWQNKAGREIRDLKKHHRRIMHTSKSPSGCGILEWRTRRVA
jgi:hypothetical protein